MKENEIWMKLLQATDTIRELHHQENKLTRHPLQTTIAEAKIMHYVVFSENGCTIKEIAERLGTTPGAASQIVEKMVKKGPLLRVPDENDRRSVRITLSPSGLERHDQISASFDTLMKKLLVGIPEEKIATFTEVLDHLIEAKHNIL